MSNPHADERDAWIAKADVATTHGDTTGFAEAAAYAAIAQVHALAYLADAVTDVYDMLETLASGAMEARRERAAEALRLRETIRSALGSGA